MNHKTNDQVINDFLNTHPMAGAFVRMAMDSYAAEVLNYQGEWAPGALISEGLWKDLAESAVRHVNNQEVTA